MMELMKNNEKFAVAIYVALFAAMFIYAFAMVK